MKKIKLTQEKFALVDNEDFEYLNQWKWYAYRNKNTYYAARTYKKWIGMHRVIMHTPEELLVDHIDHNGLNNQKYNMRNCTNAQNHYNQQIRNYTSEYKGVSWCQQQNNWRVSIKYNGTAFNLGRYEIEDIAAYAYNLAAKYLFKEFANLNKIGSIDIIKSQISDFTKIKPYHKWRYVAV